MPLSKLTRSQEQTVEQAAIDAYMASLAYWQAMSHDTGVDYTWDELKDIDKEYWRTIARVVLLSVQGPIFRHQVRDELVEVLGKAEAQISVGQPGMEHGRVLMEGDEVLVYRAPGGKLWVRFPDEFSDGRFVPVVG